MIVFPRSPFFGFTRPMDDRGSSAPTTPTQAANFVRASSQRLSIADASTNPTLDPGTGDFSYAGWIRFATLPASGEFYGICGKDAVAATGSRLYVRNTAGVVTAQFNIADAGGSVALNSGNDPFAVDTWYQVGVSADRDGNGSIYINGSVSGTPGSIAARNGDLGNAAAFTLGSIAAASYLNGRLVCTGFWTKVLSGAEMTTLYNGGSPIIRSGLSGSLLTGLASYWDLNGDATDAEGSNDLTNDNSVSFVPFP